jgi:hypothetical protein
MKEEEKNIFKSDEIEKNYFKQYDYSTNKELKTFYVIGGIHGNEIKGIEGAFLLKKYFDSERDFCKLLFSKFNIKLIPILNVVGNLAEARCCPPSNMDLEFENEKVIIKENEKKSNPPEGWNDPNRFKINFNLLFLIILNIKYIEDGMIIIH